MGFLPKGYETPKGNSNFMKFQEGVNKFRVISNALIGYEYWTVDNRPVRLRELPEERPVDIKRDKDGKDTLIKHFWAFLVIDRSDSRIKLLMVTQSSVMNQMNDLLVNPDWGDPDSYDITVSRKGSEYNTKYSVQPSPKRDFSDEEKFLIKQNNLDLEKMIFGQVTEVPQEKLEDEKTEEINIEDIPF